LEESKYKNLTPVRNKYAKGKKLGQLEQYNPNNPEHDDPKKYLYYSTGGSVYSHVIKSLEVSNTKDPIKNLALICHDIGKGVSLSVVNGLPKYLRHAKKSIELTNQIADRLKMSNKERNAIIFAVGNHMKFHDILKMKPSKIAKLVSDDNWDVLVAVGRADEFSRGDVFMHTGEFEKIIDRAIKIKEKFGMNVVNKQLKIVDGNRVMEILGIGPGQKVGEVIRKTTEHIMDNNIDVNDKETIDNLIRKYGGV